MVNKKQIIKSLFKDRECVIATMHKKEEAIAPIIEKELGIKVFVPNDFDSDKFGTFTGDIERMGDQYEAARHKGKGAMKLYKKTLSISSEGTFGPHHEVFFVPVNKEIVMLIDSEKDIEFTGVSITTETNFSHATVKSFEEAYEFALKSGFPEHGIVIKVEKSLIRKPIIIKGITKKEELKREFEFAIKKSRKKEIYIETDMRALYNPTRMKNIEAATKDLVKNLFNLCPKCNWPGFGVIDRKKGLPCRGCGFPTNHILLDIYSCKKCGHSEEKKYPNNKESVDPGECSYCNP